MSFTAKGSILKIGNSLAMSIPKQLIENFKIKKGEKVSIEYDESGLHIPLTKKSTSVEENN